MLFDLLNTAIQEGISGGTCNDISRKAGPENFFQSKESCSDPGEGHIKKEHAQHGKEDGRVGTIQSVITGSTQHDQSLKTVTGTHDKKKTGSDGNNPGIVGKDPGNVPAEK